MLAPVIALAVGVLAVSSVIVIASVFWIFGSKKTGQILEQRVAAKSVQEIDRDIAVLREQMRTANAKRREDYEAYIRWLLLRRDAKADAVP